MYNNLSLSLSLTSLQTMAPLLGLPVQEQLVEVQEKTPPPLGAPHMRRPLELFGGRHLRQLEANDIRRRAAEGMRIVCLCLFSLSLLYRAGKGASR